MGRMHPLTDVTVLDLEGRPVRLGDLWKDRRAVLVFVRHFGCLFCRQQVAELTPYLGRIRATGADVFLVGNGTVDDARAFSHEGPLDMHVLTDPSRQAYCAVGMRRGPGTVLRPGVFLKGLRAFLAGFRQTRTAGDPLQQGGIVVVDRDGQERYRYVGDYAGDHAAPEAILRACERAA